MLNAREIIDPYPVPEGWHHEQMCNLLHMKISLLNSEHKGRPDADQIIQDELSQYHDVLIRDFGLIERDARVPNKPLHPLVEWHLTPCAVWQAIP